MLPVIPQNKKIAKEKKHRTELLSGGLLEYITCNYFSFCLFAFIDRDSIVQGNDMEKMDLSQNQTWVAGYHGVITEVHHI